MTKRKQRADTAPADLRAENPVRRGRRVAQKTSSTEPLESSEGTVGTESTETAGSTDREGLREEQDDSSGPTPSERGSWPEEAAFQDGALVTASDEAERADKRLAAEAEEDTVDPFAPLPEEIDGRSVDELSEEAEALAALGALLSEEDAVPLVEDPVGAADGEGFDGSTLSAESDSGESKEEDTKNFLKGLVEAILFVSDRPLELKDVARAARLDKKRAGELLSELVDDTRHRGVRVEEVAGGFVFRTHPAYSGNVRNFLQQRPVRLSRAQIETLAIVAYRQPITRPEVDDIRGVDSGPVLKGLLERDLVRIIGKKDEPGRPMLYGTTNTFLEAFSLKNLRDLPTLREYTELTDDSRQVFEEKTGEAAPEDALKFASEQESPASEVSSAGERLAAEAAPDSSSRLEMDAESVPPSEDAPLEEEPSADSIAEPSADESDVAEADDDGPKVEDDEDEEDEEDEDEDEDEDEEDEDEDEEDEDEDEEDEDEDEDKDEDEPKESA